MTTRLGSGVQQARPGFDGPVGRVLAAGIVAVALTAGATACAKAGGDTT